jgi:hypothetical protein
MGLLGKAPHTKNDLELYVRDSETILFVLLVEFGGYEISRAGGKQDGYVYRTLEGPWLKDKDLAETGLGVDCPVAMYATGSGEGFD